MSNMTNDRVLSGHKDIAQFLGVSTKTIQRYLKFIPGRRIGTKIVTLESIVLEWIKGSSRISLNSKLKEKLGE